MTIEHGVRKYCLIFLPKILTFPMVWSLIPMGRSIFLLNKIASEIFYLSEERFERQTILVLETEKGVSFGKFLLQLSFSLRYFWQISLIHHWATATSTKHSFSANLHEYSYFTNWQLSLAESWTRGNWKAISKIFAVSIRFYFTPSLLTQVQDGLRKLFVFSCPWYNKGSKEY